MEVRIFDGEVIVLIANSSCHRVVGRLVEAGLIAGQPSPTDGRVILVELTRTGKRLRQRMAATHTKDIGHLVGARLDQTTRDALAKALDLLLD